LINDLVKIPEKMEKPLTEHIQKDKRPLSLKEYEAVGGYEALRKVMKGISPKDIQAMVKDSNLRGRGGAMQRQGGMFVIPH